MQFGMEKHAKVAFKKIFLVKSKNITGDVNTEITDLELKGTNKYLENNEDNIINHAVNNENIRIEFHRRTRAI